jgi:hypothetical protein
MDYLIGHLLGDFILQNDWQAMHKKARSLRGWIACLVHCLLYTAIVCACTGWWSWQLIVLVFLSHFPIDKTYVVARYMKVAGCFRRIIMDDKVDMHHKVWAYMIVDNTVHLTLLWLIAKAVAKGYFQ